MQRSLLLPETYTQLRDAVSCASLRARRVLPLPSTKTVSILSRIFADESSAGVDRRFQGAGHQAEEPTPFH
jgi:hypothetical protein